MVLEPGVLVVCLFLFRFSLVFVGVVASFVSVVLGVLDLHVCFWCNVEKGLVMHD